MTDQTAKCPFPHGEAHRALRETPCPRNLRTNVRDPRGYPIPYLMLPASQVEVDPRKMAKCLAEKRCMVCGKPLDNKKWFVGGHLAARNRLFTDPAMHEDCARYSLKVCPFLTNQGMKYRKKYSEGSTPAPGVSQTRSETMMLMQTTGQKAVLWQGAVYAFANRWRHVEHWLNGERVPDPPGMTLLDLNDTPGAFDPGGKFAGTLYEVEV